MSSYHLYEINKFVMVQMCPFNSSCVRIWLYFEGIRKEFELNTELKMGPFGNKQGTPLRIDLWKVHKVRK